MKNEMIMREQQQKQATSIFERLRIATECAKVIMCRDHPGEGTQFEPFNPSNKEHLDWLAVACVELADAIINKTEAMHRTGSCR